MLKILYEDKYALVINKPAGISVHGDGKNSEKTLADLLLAEYPKLKKVGEPMIVQNSNLKIKNGGPAQITIPKPGLVHRLDKDTSGVLLVAKNQTSYEFFKKQFQDHNIQKEYHAFVYGVPKLAEGTIEESIGRSGGDIRKWGTGRSARGELRNAITEYKVLERIGMPEDSDAKGSTEQGTYSHLVLYPKTGRTHQIRVHLKHINHPIVCDTIYAPNREPALGFARLALHARALTFTLPNAKEETVEAPFPKDFKSALGLAKKGELC